MNEGESIEKFLPLEIVADLKEEPKKVYTSGSKSNSEEVSLKFSSKDKVEEPPFQKFVNSNISNNQAT